MGSGRAMERLAVLGLAFGVLCVGIANRDQPARTGATRVDAVDAVDAVGAVDPAAGAVSGGAGASQAQTVATPTTAPFSPRTDVLSDPAAIGRPWGTTVSGLLTFRGNPTRSWYGTGPVPAKPGILWRYPSAPMCAMSSEYNQVRQWCGTGWTGQPAVFERDGRTWVVFGAYDRKIHFVDAATGADIIPPFVTGDLAKGTVTVDPDGYPLIYHGSRDNKFRVIAIDGDAPRELWSMDGQAIGPRLWNNDWDAAALVVNDYLIEGGENSRLHLVKLHRGYDTAGKVTASPKLVWSAPGWDDQLLAALGDKRVSLESSVMMLGDTVWVNNSGGLVQGWDFSVVRTGVGTPRRIFRFWDGDDSDATIVPDDQGYIYVGAEVDRRTKRAQQVGQLLKLDPRKPDDPVVWSIDVDRGEGSGTWSTPAIVGDTVIWPVKQGSVLGIDRTTGAVLWTIALPWGLMSSPVVVDHTLVQADATGAIHAYDITDPRVTPTERWVAQLPANIESTPAVWNGRLFVGTRDGFFYAVGDA